MLKGVNLISKWAFEMRKGVIQYNKTHIIYNISML
jgi:hypothetical protein